MSPLIPISDEPQNRWAWPRLWWLAPALIIGLDGIALFQSPAESQPRIETMPNCPERWNAYHTLDGDQPGYETAIEAAEEVRRAIFEGGGRPDGRPVEPLVQLDETQFYLPIPDTSEVDAYGLISVETVPAGGYRATFASFCAGTIPEPFPWGLAE